MLDAIAKPFGWLLMWLYELVGNYGVAVILFALIVKLVLLPFMMKSKRSMMKTSRLTPRLKELEKKHGGNRQKYNEAVAKLYKEEKINPMSGCIWSLIPFPILIALYQAIRFPLTIMMGVSGDLLAEGGAIAVKLQELGFSTGISSSYEQIAQTQFISSHFDAFSSLSDKLRQIDYSFLGLDLGAQPQWNFFMHTDWSQVSIWLPALILFLIPILAGVLTFLSSKISMKMNGPAMNNDAAGAGSMKMMTYPMPLISVWFTFMMPAALGVYWIASTFFGIIQDVWLTKKYKKIMDAEDAVRLEKERLKEEALEAKRRETEQLRAQNATVANPNTSKRKQQKNEREESREKAAEWEKKKAMEAGLVEEKEEPSRVGTRKYARGRAYDPNRFAVSGEADSASQEDEALLEETKEESPVSEGSEPQDAQNQVEEDTAEETCVEEENEEEDFDTDEAEENK